MLCNILAYVTYPVRLSASSNAMPEPMSRLRQACKGIQA